MLSSPWVWNHPNMVGWTCFTWLVFDPFVLALKTQPTWLRENHWMSMLITRGTAYLRKGKHLWDQIQTSYCYAESLCHIYDFTCYSRIDRKHLPFQCEFNENEILYSYAKGVYDYCDVEKIEDFVAFKGAYEIASLIEKYYDTIYKSRNFEVLAYCFENYVCNDYIEEFKNKMFAAQGEANDCFDEESYDYEDSLEISLSEELDTCFVDGLDATLDDAYGD